MTNHSQVSQPSSRALGTVFFHDTDASDFISKNLNLLNTNAGIIDVEMASQQLPLISVRFNPSQTRGTEIVRTVRQTADRNTCIALMYFKGKSDDEFNQQAMKAVTSQHGVVAAERSAHKAHVLLVHFDPSHTRSTQIVKQLRSQGYSALLVGC